ncbi:MAG: bifunctional cytidylyltransferase/SDR family oxidoreductase [Muribaculaceae bacterium]|nr:bifunctional cytidylyltransferase/SDR family oxidoreductase [Muribaculaceae bacterium]
MKNIAVILAGGSGTRLGNSTPKQFIKIAGKKVIEHTIAVFQNHPLINEICVVVHANYLGDIENIRLGNSFSKLRKVLVGGNERYESSLAAINAYAASGECNLIFHDSVRPLVTERIITDCIAALSTYDAVDVAVPTTDTIIQVNDRDEIISVPPRPSLRNGQTPQAFKLSVIREAYAKALQDPEFRTTDDCGVVLRYLPDTPIFVVKGEMFNMKLTYKEDIFLLDKLFQLRSIQATDSGLCDNESRSCAGKTIVVFGGTKGIGSAIVDNCREQGMNVYPCSRSTGVDVASADEVRNFLAEVHKTTGEIDYVVNTAGLLTIQPLNLMTNADIQASINTNYLGCVNVAREAFPYLKASAGSLLFFTSSSYTRGRAMYSLYSSLKAAIVNFVQATSEEWSIHNIRVNCINPERTLTPMRVENFGNEPKGTLLDAGAVAIASLKTLLSHMTGEVIDIRL